MKKLLRGTAGTLGIIGIIAMLTSFILGIWSDDDRWIHTAIVALMLGFAGVATAFYLGWDD